MSTWTLRVITSPKVHIDFTELASFAADFVGSAKFQAPRSKIWALLICNFNEGSDIGALIFRLWFPCF